MIFILSPRNANKEEGLAVARALAWVVLQAKATRDKMHVLAEECAGF